MAVVGYVKAIFQLDARQAENEAKKFAKTIGSVSRDLTKLGSTLSIGVSAPLLLLGKQLYSAGVASGATSNEFAKLRQEANALTGELGRELAPIINATLIPVLRDLMGTAKELTEDFKKLSPETQKFLVVVGEIAIVAGPAIYALGKMGTAIESLIKLFGLGSKFAVAFAGSIAGIPALIAATGAGIAGWQLGGKQAIAEWVSGTGGSAPSAGGKYDASSEIAIENAEIERQYLAQLTEDQAAATKATEERIKADMKAAEEATKLAAALANTVIASQNWVSDILHMDPNALTPGIPKTFAGADATMPGNIWADFDQDAFVGPLEDSAEDFLDSSEQFSAGVQAFGAIATLIGGKLGSILGGGGTALSGFGAIGKGGGLGNMFEAGTGGQTGIMGTLGGIANIAGPLSAIMGPVIQGIQGLIDMFGRNAGDVVSEIGRDMGTVVSWDLAEQILESGLNNAMFLSEIFSEGNMDINTLATEMKDILSIMSTGAISEEDATQELTDVLPELIAGFYELDAFGRGQAEAFLNAAEMMGVDLGELGIQLGHLVDGIAGITKQELMDKYGVTEDQVKGLEDWTALNFQNERHRRAEILGQTVEEQKEMDKELAALGISPDEQLEFLKDAGIMDAMQLEQLRKIATNTEGDGEESATSSDEPRERRTRDEDGRRTAHGAWIRRMAQGGQLGSDEEPAPIGTVTSPIIAGEAGTEVIAPLASVFKLARDTATAAASNQAANAPQVVVAPNTAADRQQSRDSQANRESTDGMRRDIRALPAQIAIAVRDAIAQQG